MRKRGLHLFMSNISISTQLKKFDCVVHLDKCPYHVDCGNFAALDKFLATSAEKYAYALHDSDINSEGTLKLRHMHIVFEAKKKTRISTLINSLADVFGVSTLAVSVDRLSSFEGATQYLIHKNNPDKFQYSSDIIHTNLEKNELELVMDSNTTPLSVGEVAKICRGSCDLLEVIDTLGLGTYQHYRAAILDIWRLTRENASVQTLINQSGF